MVKNLEKDELVAGVYSRQVPHQEASRLTRVLVNSLATAGLERREQFAGGPEQFRALPPRERRRLSAFDDVSSCIRRSVWEDFPFEKTKFGEDVRWGKRVVEAGYKLVYEPRSAVFHSHERGVLYDLRRYYHDQRLLMELFGIELAADRKRLYRRTRRLARNLYDLLRQDKEATKRGALRDALLAVRYAVPTQIGSYIGVKSRALARVSPRAFEKLDRFLSRGWG
jgi:rhamnosyltransferase